MANPVTMTADQAKQYLANYQDVANAYKQNNYGLDQTGFANAHYSQWGKDEGRTWSPLASATDTATQTPAAPATPSVASLIGSSTTGTTGTATGTQGATTPTYTPTQALAASQQYSDMAKAVAPTPAQATAQQAVATTQQVDPTKTSAGLVSQYLAADSPYLKQAQQTALDEMNGRGLLSSSLAAGAGTGAAINAAGQLATTDSGIYANQALANQSALNNTSVTNAQLGTGTNQFNAGQTNTTQNMGYSATLSNASNLMQGTVASALSTQNLGNDLTKMAAGQTYNLQNMNYGAALNIAQMKYGASLDISKLQAQTAADIAKMGVQQANTLTNMGVAQGYTLDQISVAQQNDLQKMGINFGNNIAQMQIGANLDLTKLAASNNFDVQKMALANDYQIQQLTKTSQLDTQAKTALLAISYKYDSMTKSSQFAAGLVGQKLTDINKILADPNISNVSPGNDAQGNPLPSPKQQLTTQISNELSASMANLDAVYGTNLGSSFPNTSTAAAA